MAMETSHGDRASEQRMARESSGGDTASIQRIARASSHGDTASVQRIVSLVATSEAGYAYGSERVFNERVRVNR
jgi:hypothetical protein